MCSYINLIGFLIYDITVHVSVVESCQLAICKFSPPKKYSFERKIYEITFNILSFFYLVCIPVMLLVF
jgi:hypothetical protein